MSYSRMLRFTRQNSIQYLSRLFFSRISLVMRQHSGCNQRQGIEHGCFTIRRIARGKLFHCVAVSEYSRALIASSVGLVEDFHGGDVSLLTLSSRASALCLFDRTPALLQFGRRRRHPKLMI